MDLGLNLKFEEYRKHRLCIGVELDRCCPKGDNWNNFESCLRDEILKWYNSERDETKAIHINEFWRAFCRYYSVFFTEVTQEYPEKKTVVQHYAFKVLQNLKKDSKVFTFNYTNPYEYVQLDNNETCDFNFVHGRYYKDSFDLKKEALMLQSNFMILGIDKNRIPSEIMENPYLAPIVKQQNPQYTDSGIVNKLMTAETVIFFGHSLGITDADYFEDFFHQIFEDKKICRTIYIITFDSLALQGIYQNVQSWGVNLCELKSHGVKIIPIFTSNPTFSSEFLNMLTLF